jgi:hypothetical protein
VTVSPRNRLPHRARNGHAQPPWVRPGLPGAALPAVDWRWSIVRFGGLPVNLAWRCTRAARLAADQHGRLGI